MQRESSGSSAGAATSEPGAPSIGPNQFGGRLRPSIATASLVRQAERRVAHQDKRRLKADLAGLGRIPVSCRCSDEPAAKMPRRGSIPSRSGIPIPRTRQARLVPCKFLRPWAPRSVQQSAGKTGDRGAPSAGMSIRRTLGACGQWRGTAASNGTLPARPEHRSRRMHPQPAPSGSRSTVGLGGRDDDDAPLPWPRDGYPGAGSLFPRVACLWPEAMGAR